MSYTFKSKQMAMVFEVFLPKKMSYASKLSEVLDSFLTEKALTAIPKVREYLESRPLEIKALAKGLKSIISGYSIYEVDGRFATNTGPIDERVWVIRFIVYDCEVDCGMRTDFKRLAEVIIEHLVAERFAKELGSENEVWMLEYERCGLRRWVQDKIIGPDEVLNTKQENAAYMPRANAAGC